MNIAFFGSSLVSAYWNGAATYYRGIIRALHERGHHVAFYEPDAYNRQQHRDLPDPEWARVVVYPGEGEEGVLRALESARGADLIVKASGVGVFDELLEAAVLDLQRPETLVAFWDVDAPATLDRIQNNPADPFRRLIPQYDLVLTYGGGDPVISTYSALGARRCVPIYNALDPSTHHPAPPDLRFTGDLGFLGNRLPDREARVEEFFLNAAAAYPEGRFLLGGSGWDGKPTPANVAYVGHVYTRDHNAFNRTPRAVLNISRESMARYGFSPATRVFEAAGAGACLITDAWEGIASFLEPGREVLVAENGSEVAEHLRSLSPDKARYIGDAALRRVLSEHTYAHRAVELERVLGGPLPPTPSPKGKGEPDAPASPAVHGTTTAFRSIYSPFPLGEGVGGRGLNIVLLGLSITSSWGNGHATTYRGLMRELVGRGHEVLFLERDVPWYAQNRDLPEPPYGSTKLYTDLADLKARFGEAVRNADCVLVGSYVPEGVAVGEWVTQTARGVTAFYDIDTPVTLAKLGRGDTEYLSPALIPRYHLYLSFTGGPILERLEKQFGSPRARPLYCAVDPALYYPEEAAPLWDLGYMGTYSDDRQPPLERLMLDAARRFPQGRFVVAGPQYPPEIVWPGNIERREHLPPAEHRAFYCSQRFTLNITRKDMIEAGYSPSVRLFEAAACGTPIISDCWEGLETFFASGKEILMARSENDTLRFLREMPDEERRAIGERARVRVLGAHTAAHRAAELESCVREVISGTQIHSHGKGTTAC